MSNPTNGMSIQVTQTADCVMLLTPGLSQVTSKCTVSPCKIGNYKIIVLSRGIIVEDHPTFLNFHSIEKLYLVEAFSWKTNLYFEIFIALKCKPRSGLLALQPGTKGVFMEKIWYRQDRTLSGLFLTWSFKKIPLLFDGSPINGI